MITFYVYYNNFCCFVLLFDCRHSSCRIFEDIKAGWLAEWMQLQLQLDLATLICHSYGPSMSLMLEHNLWHEGIIIVIIFIGVVAAAAVAIVDDNSILMANCRVVFILMKMTTTMIIIYYLLKIRKLPKDTLDRSWLL